MSSDVANSMFKLIAGGSVAIAVAVLVSTGAHAQGNVENGEDVFRKCRSCHLVGEGAKDTVGPALNGVIGRKAGAGETYKLYSDNIKELADKGLVWDDSNLDKYLENPKSVIPQGKMSFVGLKDKTDRDDVIAYLKKYTK
jgi:cytochrome c